MFAFPEAVVLERAQADGITHMATGVAVERGGKILVVRRAAEDSLPGMYELPGGGVDPGESVTEGATRELHEEAGLTVRGVLGTFTGFDYTTSSKKSVRQINFLVEADGDVQLSHEHDDYRWITPDDLAALETSDEMKACLTRAFAAFKEYQSVVSS